MSESTQLGHFAPNAIINLSLGGEMIGKLQTTLLYLTDGMSESDSNILQGKITRKEPLVGKDLAIVTISTLIMAITKEAERTNQIVYKSIEETFSPQ